MRDMGGVELATFRLSTFPTEESDSLGATPESLVQPSTNIIRQGEELAVAIKLDRFSRVVKHRVTMMALAEVDFDSPLQFLVEFTIKVI